MNKSHRDIKPETLTGEPKPPKPKNVKQYKKPERKPIKMNNLKRVINFVAKTVARQNKIGEGLHGILDLLPVPNQIIAKAFSYISEGEPDKAKDEMKKLLSMRNAVALIAFILFVTGVITMDDVVRILSAV